MLDQSYLFASTELAAAGRFSVAPRYVCSLLNMPTLRQLSRSLNFQLGHVMSCGIKIL